MTTPHRLKTHALHLLAVCVLAVNTPAQANLIGNVSSQQPAAFSTPESSEVVNTVPPIALSGPRPILLMLDYAGTTLALTGINEEIKTLKSVLVNTQVINNPDGHLIQQIVESVAADPLCVPGAGTLVWYSGRTNVVSGAVHLLGNNEINIPLETVLQALGRAKCAVLLVIDAGNDDYSQPPSASGNVSILWPAQKGQKAWADRNGSVISRTFAAALRTKPGQDWTAQPLVQALQIAVPLFEIKGDDTKQTPWVQARKPDQTVLFIKK